MKQLILCSLLLLAGCVSAQQPPADYLSEWSGAGAKIDYSKYTHKLDVTAFGAKADGVTDATKAVTDAISSLNGKAGVIYFPSGKYLLTKSINLPDSVILRGNSSDSVEFILLPTSSDDHFFRIQTNPSSNYQELLSGYTRGSNKVVVQDVTAFKVGDQVEIQEENGSWDTNPASWAKNSVGQISKVTAVSGDTLMLAESLRLTMEKALNPQIRTFIPRTGVGIEGIKLTRADSTGKGQGLNVVFSYAVNCWMRGVESNRSHGPHVLTEASSHMTITGSYFHHAYDYSGSGARGYGVTLTHHTGDCLITNNIFHNLRHSMMVKQGANGNVFSYNYSVNPVRSEFPTDAGGDISLHGHYPYANLFEGNIIQNIHIDLTWGPNGPYNAFLRNRAELYGIVMTSGGNSDTQIFVGNEVTGSGLFKGNYILAGNGHFEFANNIKGNIKPTAVSELDVNSYYLNTAPTFWTIQQQWPSIGVPYTLGAGSNPARERYLEGQKLTVLFSSPIAIFESDTVVCVGDVIKPINTSSLAEGIISNYEWNFGDGFSSIDTSAEHAFQQAGQYEISLKITSDMGLTSTFKRHLTVLPVPDADFETEQLSATEFKFTPKDIDSSLSYTWSFGDGDSSIGITAMHEFMSQGSYDVVLVASNGACSSSKAENVSIVITSIAKPESKEEINVYPTCFTNSITVSAANLKGNVSIQVTDINGKAVYNNSYGSISGSFTEQISLNLSKGIYILRLLSRDVNHITKIIRQ